MAIRIKYTVAEKESFRLCPETCPTIEKAFDEAFSTPSVENAEVAEIFAKYGIAVNRNMSNAIYEVLSKHLFPRKIDLLKVVQMEGTFPLRRALVEKIEGEMIANGIEIEQNHYKYWIDTHESMKKLRAERMAKA